MKLECPVCGEFLNVPPPGACPECGALLTSELLEATASEPALPPASAQPPAQPPHPEGEEADELTRAFRDQFERHQVYLPAEWVSRLHRLASEAEVSRRQAMVFFVDLRGFTELSNVLTDKQLDELLQWFYALCTRHVERHGGFVISMMGDAVFAAFGAPWAFERDAESGLRALLEIREAVRRRGDIAGYPLAIRAGVDCGTLSVRLTEVEGQKRPDLLGPAVNLAARLEVAADTWDILASDALADQVRHAFDLEERPAFVPKNIGRPVRPWAVLSCRAEHAERRQDFRFVGRDSELGRLSDWAHAVAAGSFVAVRLQGESGIGKTRLVQELFNQLDVRPWRRVYLDRDPHSRYSLMQAMVDLLKRLAAPALTAEDRLEALRRQCPDLDPAIWPSIGYLLGMPAQILHFRQLPGPVLRAQVVAGLVELISRLAAWQPILLFLDNLQWIDQLSWEVLERLVARRPHGLMLIVAMRPASESPGRLAAPEADFEFDPAVWLPMSLEPLDPPARELLLRQIVDDRDLHPLLRRRLLLETEGIPLYLIELARHLAEQGELLLERQLERTLGAGREELPAVIVEILQARIDKLQAQRRAILQCGAALGTPFRQGLIQVFEQSIPRLLSELYALKGLRMLRDQQLPEDIVYYFTPSLLRDVAYRMMTTDQQIELHRTIAVQFEQHFADRADELAYELAIHWLNAAQPRRARRYLRRAGRRALAQGAPAQAYELARQSLSTFSGQIPAAASDLSPAELVELQQRALLERLAGVALRLMGDFRQSDSHFQSWLSIAARVDNPDWLADARYQLAANAMETGDIQRARHELEAASADSLDTARHLRNLNVRGALALRAGDLNEALALFEDIPRLTASRPDATSADAWNNAGIVQWQMGRLDDARHSFERALAIWRSIDQQFGAIATCSNLGIIAEKKGQLDRAVALYEQSLLDAERLGYLHGISAIEANLANLCLLRRQFFAARDHAARALHAARLIGHRNSEMIALENLGLSLARLGLIDEAAAALDEATILSETAKDPIRRGSSILARAFVDFLSDNLESMAARLQRVSDSLSPDLAPWHAMLDRALVAQQARRLVDWPFLQDLERLRTDASLEDYLRLIEIGLLLADRGVSSLDRDMLESRRDEVLAAVPDAVSSRE